MGKGLRVAIDGYDGAGKSTLIKLLREVYSDKYVTAVEHLLPITIDIFKKYTNNTNKYLGLLDDEFRVMSYLWESYIRLKMQEEMYDSNDIIFFDRWIFTNLTRELDFGIHQEFIEYLINSIQKPNLLILIETSSANIINRLGEKNDWMLQFYSKREIERESIEFYQGYKERLQKYDGNYIVIDGNNSLHELILIIKKHIDQLIYS